MPKITEMSENVSDDEFEDALSEVPKTAAVNPTKVAKDRKNEDYIEEIIEQQINMSLKDDDNCGDGDDDDDFKDAKPDSKEDDKPIGEQILDDDEVIEELMADEDELRELEKTMSAEQLQENKEKANQMKLEANELFKNDKAFEALELYTQALKLCPTIYPKERAVLYGNRAAAKIKCDLKKTALTDCTQAINLWPEYVRVILRRAKLHEGADELDKALEDYKRCVELDPGQHEAREACVRLPPIINQRNEKLKEECLEKLKDLGNMILKPFGLSTANFQMQQDPNSGGYSINFNQNAS